MTEPGSALEQAPPVRAMEALMNDDEIRRAYRIAEALYASGAYKDVKRAEVAFAKIVIGRDLGLSPAQAMGGIHLVEGGVQMHYAMLGQFVRAREGYDYRPGWIKQANRPGAPVEGEVVDDAELVVVWHDEEDPADMRPIVGAVVEFTVAGKRRGVSRYTLEDARAANLIKDSNKAAWNTSPRNMLLARAISNGVKWFVPEALGGLPVYVEGELPSADRKSLTAGSGDDNGDGGQGIDLGPQVEKIIKRGTELGHRGLSNRAAVELAVGGRAPGAVKEWCERANAELDRFSAEKLAAAATDPGDEPDDVPEEVPVEAPPEEVTAEPVEEAPHDDPRDRLADVEFDEAPESTVNPGTVEGEVQS
jgi:hypothetical protein